MKSYLGSFWSKLGHVFRRGAALRIPNDTPGNEPAN
jgi:hypothetical protein